MNFTQNDIDKAFEEWKSLSIIDRDLIVYKALFDKNATNSPMFSANMKDSVATNNLINRLKEFDFPPLKVSQLPRSTLSVVSCGDCIFPQMPYHKGVALICYMVAKNEN